MKKYLNTFLLILLSVITLLSGCAEIIAPTYYTSTKLTTTTTYTTNTSTNYSVTDIPEYSGSAYIVLNNNEPEFTETQKNSTESYEIYSDLDQLGRCGVCIANIGSDLMPTTERGNISSVKPTGWHSVQYDIVDGKSLYNRCHLIGWQLTAENANYKNLITGTRYLNVTGMLPFENMVADYIKETNNHVLYRVTPYFTGNNLIADGVQIEAYSIEDNGDGILFNVYCYNVQPGIVINYATGDSYLDTSETITADESETATTDEAKTTYILNTNTKKFHLESCPSADKISSGNKVIYLGTREQLIEEGYTPCGSCNP